MIKNQQKSTKSTKINSKSIKIVLTKTFVREQRSLTRFCRFWTKIDKIELTKTFVNTATFVETIWFLLKFLNEILSAKID